MPDTTMDEARCGGARFSWRALSNGLVVSSAVVAVVVSGVGPVMAGPRTLMVGVDHVPPSGAPEALMSVVDTFDGTITRCYSRARICFVEVPEPTSPDLVLDVLVETSGVRSVERDRLMPGGVPPRYSKHDADGTEECPDLWELDAVGAREAWTLAEGELAPVIAIQDSGFLTTHEEIVGRISGQYDYGNLDTDPEVEWGAGIPDHGTFIAAMLVGNPDNGVGRTGLAPLARVNLQKIADNDGALYFSYAVAALADLADGDLGVRVLNYSIGTPTATDAFRDAVEALDDVGILLVTAAGNCSVANCTEANNDPNPLFPGSYTFEHVVVVAGSTADGELNPYSHYGASSVDLAAPGVNLCSAGARGDDNYYTAGGTSYATPLVAATAALIFERHPILTPTEVARVLRVSARRNDSLTGIVRSGGVLNMPAALRAPVPRFAPLLDAEINGTTNIDFLVENVGDAGETCLVISHPEEIEVVGGRDLMTDACWTRRVATANESDLSLPDAGDVHLAAGRVTALCGPIDRHTSPLIRLYVRGHGTGQWPIRARVVMSNDEITYLNAPYRAGEDDATGFRAWPATWTVTAIAQESDDPCAPEEDPEDVGTSGDGGADVGSDIGEEVADDVAEGSDVTGDGPADADVGSMDEDAEMADVPPQADLAEEGDDVQAEIPTPGSDTGGDDDGCGCQLVRKDRVSGAPWMLFVGAFLLARLRRR